MPLNKIITFNSSTKILVWKITESFDDLYNEVILTKKSQNRLDGMKSEMHQKGFLSVRKLLQEANYSDNDLFYDEFGKPHLIDNKYISISHSHQFATIIVSDKLVGIDIELQRDKIIAIANKFVNDNEFQYLNKANQDNYIKKLTIIWGAKEAIFKIINQEGISFKDHIFVENFEMDDKKTIAILEFNNKKEAFSIHFEEIEGFILVFAFQNLSL